MSALDLAAVASVRVGQPAGNDSLTLTEGRKQLRELGRTVPWQGAQDIAFAAA